MIVNTRWHCILLITTFPDFSREIKKHVKSTPSSVRDPSTTITATAQLERKRRKQTSRSRSRSRRKFVLERENVRYINAANWKTSSKDASRA
eukprot:jgi/Bigna1/63317/fgenesh1_kg.51_\